MKKKTTLLTSVLAVVSMLASCSGESEDTPKANLAQVSFTYTLDTSTGSAMKAPAKTARKASGNSSVFSEFYTKIKSGDLVAETYDLTMTNLSTGEEYDFSGKWDTHKVTAIPTGRYKVAGTSTATGDNIQEKCSIKFSQEVEVVAGSNDITLNADYDCYLLVFTDKNITSVKNYSGQSSQSLFTFGNYKYAFVNERLYAGGYQTEAYIGGSFSDGTNFTIPTGTLAFEKGKYYVYNTLTNSFSIPEMEEGNLGNREIEGFGRVADAVDLGLSVKWASWNVGASQIADYGGLYGMGDPTGLLTSTNESDYYFVDGESICGTSYDLAHVKWGGNWRLPTSTELKELRDKCTWTAKVTKDCVLGSVATGPNGNNIFFPYAGYRTSTTIYERDDHTSIWTGNMGVGPLHSSGYDDMEIFANGTFRNDGCPNYLGQSIRPVCE